MRRTVAAIGAFGHGIMATAGGEEASMLGIEFAAKASLIRKIRFDDVARASLFEFGEEL